MALQRKQYSRFDKEKTIYLASKIGTKAAAREAGVCLNTLHMWRCYNPYKPKDIGSSLDLYKERVSELHEQLAFYESLLEETEKTVKELNSKTTNN